MILMGYAEDKNKFLKSYDPSKPTSYDVKYLDANTVQRLPFEIIDWVDAEKFNVDNYPDNGSIGCFLEVDFDYPDELHDLHKEQLKKLAAEKMKVKIRMLSEYQSKIIEGNFSLGKKRKTYS